MILKYKCPCCGNYTLGEERCYEICPICNWEDDPIQFEDPNFKGGANSLSLNEARTIFSKLNNEENLGKTLKLKFPNSSGDNIK